MINYQKLFDFDGLEKKIGSIDAEYQKFVKNTDSGSAIVQRAIDSYEKSINALLKDLKALNLATSGADVALGERSRKTEEYGKRLTELRGIMAALTDAQSANEISLKNLKDGVKLLKSEYDSLDPKASNFKQQQSQIAEKVKLVKQAIDGQNATLKAANQTLGSTVNSYTRLAKETNELRTKLKSLDNAFDSTTGAINKNNKIAVDYLRIIQQNDAALKKMDASMGLHQRNVGDYGNAWRGAKGDLLAFVGITTAVDTALRAVTKTFEVINTFDRYRSVIQFASGDTAVFNNNLAMLDRLADKTGMDIEVLYTKFGSFSVAGKAANMTVAETNRLFQSIVKAGGAYKMSNEAISLSLKAFEQIMNKNKLSMEEISQQLGDHLPGSLSLFATALGVSTEKLTQMIKNGDLFAKETLPLVADRLDKTVGPQAQNNVNTMGGAWNRLTNQAKLLIDQFAQDNGIQNFFSTAINGTATWLSAIREAVRSKEWASFVAVALGNPTEVRRMIGRQTSAEFERRGLEAEREGIYNSMSKMTPQQRELLIQGKQQQFAEAARAGTSSQAKARESQELLKVLNIYKEVNKELKVANDLAKKPEPVDQMKALNKEIRETQKILESKGKNYTKTAEGAALLAKYNALVEERKQIKIAAGTRQPDRAKSAKEEDNAYEKSLKELAKRQDGMINKMSKDLSKGKLAIPKEDLESWDEAYSKAKMFADAIGKDIPDNIEKFNNRLNPYQAKKPTGKVLTMEQLLDEVMKGENIKPIAATANAEMGDMMSTYINLTKEQGFEALKLMESFSRSLRGLKKSERDTLIALQQEIFDAQKAGDKEREAAAVARFNAEKERILAERDLRRQITQEAFSLVATVERGISDVRTAYRNNQISAIEKQKENEIKLAGENAEAKEAIEKRTDEQIRQIRTKQAKADRQAALFNIALNTAQAIMSVLSTGGGTRFADAGISAGILTALVAANGLAQAALVMATPLPAFKKGTRYAPEGPALVAEEGAELHESQGKYFLHEKPSIVPLKRGDKIYTAEETSRMLGYSQLMGETDNSFTRSKLTSVMAGSLQASQQKAQMNMHYAIAQQLNMNADRIGQTVANAVSGLPVNETHFDEDGVWERQRRLNSVVTYRKLRHGF